MTRTLWIRVGSLAAIIGSIGPVVLCMFVLTILLVNRLAPQAPLSLDLPGGVGWVFTAQRAFYVLALIALWIRGANRTGVFGWAAIALALAGSIIAVVGSILFMSDLIHGASQMLLYSNVILIGSVIPPIGIILFGVTTLKYRLLPHLNWLPLVVGLTELLSFVAPLIGANIFLLDLLKFSILLYATSLVVTTAWILLGIALWPRRNEQTAARDVPASVEPAI